jgi:hypothetical protein
LLNGSSSRLLDRRLSGNSGSLGCSCCSLSYYKDFSGCCFLQGKDGDEIICLFSHDGIRIDTASGGDDVDKLVVAVLP